MTRPLIAAAVTALAATTLASTLMAAPAAATAKTQTIYGYAWADGSNHLRITPAKAKLVTQHGVRRYKLTTVPGAKERRVFTDGVRFRRITTACDLKETEGRIRQDKKGLGTTDCDALDLKFVLSLGPTPVKITITPSLTTVAEFLAVPTNPVTAYGQLTRVDDRTVLFKRSGRAAVKLRYTHLGFNRVTKSCSDGWTANVPNEEAGIGTKPCSATAFRKAIRHAGPVTVKVYYQPVSGHLWEVWEALGD
uniref:hypothetical protein n=1 Tax=Herbidospora sakaeratensis TaxID=564415 RepID=UPI0007851E42|nr:hypothetical protein [Herbidospora sakaeratensis]